jgi:energy-coupling factor transport system permease protein
MFKDITIGQFFPATSVIHRLDARTKIIATFAYIILLFVITNIWGYLAAFVFLAAIIIMCRIPVKIIFNGLKGLILIIMITVVLNLFMTPGTPVFTYGALTMTAEGIRNSLYMALRLIFLIVGTNIMTLTTSPIDLTDGMEFCMRGIPFVRRYAHELAMMMSIALRFIPTLMEETDKIMKAQMARGADFETGNLIARAKSLIPILVPLFISAFRRADELATAMEARCYRGGENRTRMNQLHFEKRDGFALAVMLVFTGLVIGSRFVAVPLPFLV